MGWKSRASSSSSSLSVCRRMMLQCDSSSLTDQFMYPSLNMLFSRDIIVFSAEMAAFTLPHGTGKTTGPDLLVSYHDNDHYNSVRLSGSATRASPAPIEASSQEAPRKPMTKTKTHQDEIEKNSEETESNQDCNLTESNGNSKQSVKKSAPCPCGSGLKYKQCCLIGEKHAARVKNLRDESSCPSSDEEETKTMANGGFRVLHI
jgi:hypothetical protein